MSKKIDTFPKSGIKWDISTDPAAIKKIKDYFDQDYKQNRKFRWHATIPWEDQLYNLSNMKYIFSIVPYLPKPDEFLKNKEEWELYIIITQEIRRKLQQDKFKWNALIWYIKRIILHNQVGLLQEYKAGSIFNTQCNTVVSTGYGGKKSDDHINWCRQSTWQNPIPIHNNKDLSKLRIEGNFINLIWKLTVSMVLNDEKLNVPSTRSQEPVKDVLPYYSYSTSYWSPSQCNKKRK